MKQVSILKNEKIAKKLRPRDEWIEIEVPAIIDDDTFRKAEEQLKRNILWPNFENTIFP